MPLSLTRIQAQSVDKSSAGSAWRHMDRSEIKGITCTGRAVSIAHNGQWMGPRNFDSLEINLSLDTSFVE